MSLPEVLIEMTAKLYNFRGLSFKLLILLIFVLGIFYLQLKFNFEKKLFWQIISRDYQ